MGVVCSSCVGAPTLSYRTTTRVLFPLTSKCDSMTHQFVDAASFPLPTEIILIILKHLAPKDLYSMLCVSKRFNSLLTCQSLRRHVASLLLGNHALIPLNLTRSQLQNLQKPVPKQSMDLYRMREKVNLSSDLPVFVRPVYFALIVEKDECSNDVVRCYSASFESSKGGFFQIVAVPWRPGQSTIHMRGAIFRTHLGVDSLQHLETMRKYVCEKLGPNALIFVHSTKARSLILDEVLEWGNTHKIPISSRWCSQQQLDGFVI